MPPRTVYASLATVTTEAAAYAAGFLDGEGTVSITTAGGHPFIYITISQSEPGLAALRFIQSFYGGSLTHVKNTGFAARFPKYVLGIRSQPYVARFLRSTLPYMIVKHEKGERALALLDEKSRDSTWWTPEEDALLLQNYRRGEVESLARLMGRTRQAVWAHYKVLIHRPA